MADETRASILDGLRAGSVIVAEDSDTDKPVRETDNGIGERAAPKPVAFAVDAAPAGKPAAPASNPGDAAGEFDRAELSADDAFGDDPPEPAARATDAGIDRRGAPEAVRKRNETRARNQKISASVGIVESILVSAHTVLASALKQELWEITPEEASKMATALATVEAQYNISLDAKTQAWINLAMVGGSIYGPRAIAHFYIARGQKAAREPQPVSQPQATKAKPNVNGFGLGPLGSGDVRFESVGVPVTPPNIMKPN